MINKKGTGILQQLLLIEEDVMRHGEEAVDALRKAKDPKTMEAYYDWVDGFITEQYKSKFGVE